MTRLSMVVIALVVLCTTAFGATGNELLDQYAASAMKECMSVATEAQDESVFDYCMVEKLRPVVKGRTCIVLVAGMNNPSLHCSKEGTLFYRRLRAAPNASLSDDEMAGAFSNMAGKHTQASIAFCLAEGKGNDAAVACLEKQKEKIGHALRFCSNAQFRTDSNAELLQAVDHCVEYRMKL